MTSYRLTRHLYALDEVALTLMTALLARRDLDECYYWTAELAASGLDAFPWLWWLYYSFYAELNPRLEAYMRSRAASGAFRDACAIVRNMHRSRPTPTVFLLDQGVKAGSLGAKGRPEAAGRPFPHYPPTHQPWLASVKAHDMRSAVPQLAALAREWCPSSLFQVLCDFHAEHMEAAVDRARMLQYWEERPGVDDLHHLVALMVHLLRAPGDYDARRLFIAPKDTGLAYLSAGRPFGRPDRLLSAGRKYPTGEGIAPFRLAREELVEGPLETLRHHWEYHCSGCPLWRQRLQDCGATLDHEKRDVEFRTDEGLEAFYALHGVEPDEQPLALQMLSTGELSGGGCREWLDAGFGTGVSEWIALPADWVFDARIDCFFR